MFKQYLDILNSFVDTLCYGLSAGLLDSVNLTCTPETWRVRVDTQQLQYAYPTSVRQNIFMSNTFCPGFLDGDVLVFNSSYDDCNTKTKVGNRNKSLATVSCNMSFW